MNPAAPVVQGQGMRMAKKAAAKKKVGRTTRQGAAKRRAKPEKQYGTRADLHAPVAVAIDAMPSPQRETAWALDALIRRCAGKRDVASQVKWGNANYCVGGIDLFAIAASKAYVSLYVGNGAKLTGACAAILEGGGKLMRHVKCRTREDASRKQVREIIVAAIAIAENEADTAWNKR